MIIDHAAFFCLATCTLCERTFFKYAIDLYRWFFRKPAPIKYTDKDTFKNMSEGSIKGDFESMKSSPLLSSKAELDSDDDDFEGGNNQIELKDEIDVEDEQKFKKLIGGDLIASSSDLNNNQGGTDFQMIEQDPLAVRA